MTATATPPTRTSQTATAVTPGTGHAGKAARRSEGLKVAWVPNQDLEHPAWVEVGYRLGAMSRVSRWWVGDWLQYGEAKWGKKYAEAARITGYDVKTLRNISYVAKRFDLSRRRDKLTWSHHAELAGLMPHEQDLWLDKASADRLSVADLRQELRCSQRAPKVDEACSTDSSTPLDIEEALICPHCGHRVPLPPSSL
jgi:hypothetical protein